MNEDSILSDYRALAWMRRSRSDGDYYNDNDDSNCDNKNQENHSYSGLVDLDASLVHDKEAKTLTEMLMRTTTTTIRILGKTNRFD